MAGSFARAYYRSRRYGNQPFAQITQAIGDIIRENERRKYLDKLGKEFAGAYERQKSLAATNAQQTVDSVQPQPSPQAESMDVPGDFILGDIYNKPQTLAKMNENTRDFASKHITDRYADYKKLQAMTNLLSGLEQQYGKKPVNANMDELLSGLEGVGGEDAKAKYQNTQQRYIKQLADLIDRGATTEQINQYKALAEADLNALKSQITKTDYKQFNPNYDIYGVTNGKLTDKPVIKGKTKPTKPTKPTKLFDYEAEDGYKYAVMSDGTRIKSNYKVRQTGNNKGGKGSDFFRDKRTPALLGDIMGDVERVKNMDDSDYKEQYPKIIKKTEQLVIQEDLSTDANFMWEAVKRTGDFDQAFSSYNEYLKKKGYDPLNDYDRTVLKTYFDIRTMPPGGD